MSKVDLMVWVLEIYPLEYLYKYGKLDFTFDVIS